MSIRRAPPGVPMAVLFTDIVGSTDYFSRHGDPAGLDLVERHNRLLFPLIEAADGRVVKTLGDGVLAAFRDPAAAIQVGATAQRLLAEIRAPDDELHVRVGIHFGLVLETRDDVFGDVVNLTERVKSAGKPDQVVVSRNLREMVKTDPRFAFETIGLHELKGCPEAMELFLVRASPELQPLSRSAAAFRRMKRRKAWALWAAIPAVAFGVLLLIPSAEPSAVAVLPFRNTSGDPEIEYLRVAIAEELNIQLRSAGLFQVRPLSAVRGIEAESWDRKKMLEEVRAGTIVEGSLLRVKDSVRLNVAVVDVRANRHIWSESFEEPLGDTLALLSRASRRILAALNARARENPGTKDGRAFDHYLRGVALLQETTAERCDGAIRALTESTRLDGNFARAHAALSRALATKYWWNFSNDRAWLERAEASARRSLELDSSSAEGHYALAYAVEAMGRRAECVKESLESFRADPNYAPALLNLARYSFYMGEFDAALHFLDRMGQLDPTQNIALRRAIYQFFAGRLEDSRAEARKAEGRAIGVDELTLLAIAYVWIGDPDSAERILERLKQADPGALSVSEVQAWLFTARGDVPEARAAMERISKRTSWGIVQGMAAMYALQGEKALALEWLQRAVDLGAPSYAWYASSHFQTLYGDPTYEAILRRLESEYAPLRGTLRALH
jgi:adenylate cyclase